MTDEVVQAADAVITMAAATRARIYPGKRYEDWEVDESTSAPAAYSPSSAFRSAHKPTTRSEFRMPGASTHTRRVKILNANWTPSPEGGDGRFELLIVTDDDERYAIPTSPGSVAAIVALATADTVLVWDPDGPALICANVIGEMPWTRQQ